MDIWVLKFIPRIDWPPR